MGVEQGIAITAEQRNTVLALLKRYLPGTTAWVYGSRAKGTSTSRSDLDLVVFSTPQQRRQVGDLREAFEESNLPFRVDLFVWDDVPCSFRTAQHAALANERVVPRSPKLVTASEWMSIRLGPACAKIGSGATPRGGSSVYSLNGPCALIRSQNVFNDRFRRDGLVYISEEHASSLANVVVLKHDVLLNITGDSVARTCQVDPEILPARVNQHVAIIRPNPEKIVPRFLRYALVSSEMQARLLSWARAGGTRNALTKSMIESVDVLVPTDIREQHAIAHILGSLDEKIDLNRRMHATLEAMAHALFKSWFVDFDPVRAKMEGRDTGLPRDIGDLFPDRLMESELGQIPNGWNVTSLGNILELAYGKALKAQNRRNDGTVPVYGSRGQIGWHDTRLVQGPGIVVGRKGNPGVITWVPSDFYPIDTTFYVVPTGDSRAMYFLFYALKRQNLPAIDADSAVPGLSRKLAYLNRQIAPDERIVEQFGICVSRIFSRCSRLSAESFVLSSLRNVLLSKLMSGQMRVTDVNDAKASY